MSVPTRRGPWWYYSRTEEGKDYGIHCRRPARGRQELPPAGEPGQEEQILLDENALAEGSDYFAVGSAAVSHDHRWLAYSTDHRGDEKYELRFRPLDAEVTPASEAVPDTGYGLAWSAAADFVFYVRLDEAQRPFQLWRHQLGQRPGRRRARLRGGRPALLARHRLDPGHRVRADRPAQHQHHRVARHPLGRPARRAPRRAPPARGHRVRRGPPHAGLGRSRLVRRPDQRGRAGLPRARRPRCRTRPKRGPHRGRGRHGVARGGRAPPRHTRRGRRCLRQRPRPQRARRGPDARCACSRCPRATLSPATCSARAGSCPRSRAPRRPGSAPTPSRTHPRCASGACRS